MKILPTIRYYSEDEMLKWPAHYTVNGRYSIRYCRTWFEAYCEWFKALVKG